MAYRLVNRKEPTDLDDGPQQRLKVVEFNVSRPWPEKVLGLKFGPSLIHRTMQSGLYVLAKIQEAPKEVSVYEARWKDGALQVRCGEGWRFPVSLRTVSPADLRGVRL